MKRSAMDAKQENSVPQEIPSEEIQTGKVTVKEVLQVIWRVAYGLRRVFMSVPVVYYALQLAAYNSDHLPEQVGINLLSNGEYAYTISRAAAIQAPLFVTAVCLGLMFFSRKTVYPWLISVFSLVLPVLVLLTNLYPA